VYKLPFASQEFLVAWTQWQQYRKERKKPLTPTTIGQQLKKLATLGEKTAIEWIECAIEKQWQGLYPPPQQKTNDPRPLIEQTTYQKNGFTQRPLND